MAYDESFDGRPLIVAQHAVIAADQLSQDRLSQIAQLHATDITGGPSERRLPLLWIDEIVCAVTLILTGPGQTAVHRATEFTLHGVPVNGRSPGSGAGIRAYETGEREPVVTVTGPAGLTTTVPSFPEAGGWRVRFAAPLAGRWQLVAAHGVDRSPPLFLEVAADPAALGMIHPQGRGFRYESGEPFLPLGADLGPLADAAARLAELAGAGATVVRVAAQPPSSARDLDEVLDLAAAHEIAVLLTLPAADWTAHAGARVAAHPALFAWSPPSPEWTPVVRAIDPYGHPIAGVDFEIGSTLGDLPVLLDTHASPWAAIFSGYAGHLADLRFRGLRTFLAGESPGQLTPIAMGKALGLTSASRALLWFASTSDEPVALGGFVPGAYAVIWCSTEDGSALHHDRVVVAEDGKIRLVVPALPGFPRDVAVRVVPAVPAQRTHH
jgi:hypothetical protein